jgi:RNA polymerase sigma-70 factor (ECF subfamily)
MNKNKYLSDTVLIANYQNGDKKALSLLVKKWHLHFCNFAFWIVKDADISKDIAQESWTVILNKLDTLQEPEKFKSWAISIVNRKAIDFIRERNREQVKLEKHYLENRSEETIQITDDLIKNKLLKSIENLSVEHQLVVRLFYKESYSLKEISEILTISEGTVKSRLFHAREKLKTIFKKYKNEK